MTKTLFAKYQSTANDNLIYQGVELQQFGENLSTPKVLTSYEHCLLLVWIDKGNWENYQQKIGLLLANLQHQSQHYLGFEFDNTISKWLPVNKVF